MFNYSDQISDILEANNVNNTDTTRIMRMVIEILDEVDSVIGDSHMDCASMDSSSESEEEVMFSLYLNFKWLKDLVRSKKF